ncbi:MAG: hypothetical protein HIU89_15000 [Proteobacteria bacterium]|nr:hypothetical protein [Pseudomonadota bacterium]
MKGVEDPSLQALAAHSRRSLHDTRHKLELAVRRLVHGNPRVVKKGAKLSASTVAAEAGVDRATLYRFHEPILTEIRRINDSAPKAMFKERRAQLAGTQAKLRDYRKLIEEAQGEVGMLARINYRLKARIDELEMLLKVRDERVTALQLQINAQVRPTRLRSAPDH